MRFYWFMLGALAVWRFTHLLHVEDGPWDLLARLRRRAAGPFWGSLLGCFYCLSLWIALPVARWIGIDWLERILQWPALSAAAIVIERVTSKEIAIPGASYYYETVEENDVLRTETNEAERRLSA